MTKSKNDSEQSIRAISNYLICKPFRLDLSCLRNGLNELSRLSTPISSFKPNQCQEANFSTVECQKQLHEMWKEKKFCDLIITVNDREYLAHCLAIALHSPKLKDFFELNKTELVIRLNLEKSNSLGIENVLKYVYKSQLELTIQNFDAITTCAQELELNYLINKCEIYLSNLDSNHVVQALNMAYKLDLKLSFDYLFCYFCLNLDKCIIQTHFVKLNKDLLLKLMKYLFDNKTSRNETLLFERILAWLDSNQALCSLQSALALLNLIEFKKLSSNHIDYVLARHKFVYQIPNLVKYFQARIIK